MQIKTKNLSILGKRKNKSKAKKIMVIKNKIPRPESHKRSILISNTKFQNNKCKMLLSNLFNRNRFWKKDKSMKTNKAIRVKIKNKMSIARVKKFIRKITRLNNTYMVQKFKNPLQMPIKITKNPDKLFHLLNKWMNGKKTLRTTRSNWKRIQLFPKTKMNTLKIALIKK